MGKRDSDVALLRIKTYVCEVPSVVAQGVEQSVNGKKSNYVHIDETPDPKYCQIAWYALKCYYEFIQNSPENEPKILSRGKGWNDWHNSDSYQLGIDALNAASTVLQHFNYAPEWQKPVAEKLGELRALACSVAELISKSPSVHESYFVGDRVVTHDELSHTMHDNPNIFRCKVDWGCYWQERPEDTIALYRELMSSPVFCYLHQDLWLRPAERPRLVGWNEEDRRRIPAVWNDFLQGLQSSPDILLQLEGKAFALADADNDQKMGESFTNLFKSLIENRESLLTNNVEVLYLDWGAGAFVDGGGVVTDLKESLHHLYYSEYRPKLEAMDQEYWTKTIPNLQFSPVFQRQMQYLKDNKPYEFFEFAHLFETSSYSKAQAVAIQPLIAAYKSNLVVQSENASGIERGKLIGAIAQVGFLEGRVDRIPNPPAPQPRPPAPTEASASATVARTPIVAPVSAQSQEIVTNVLRIDKFLEIPLDSLGSNEVAGIIITAHHWVEGKLLLNLEYGAFIYSFDANGKWSGTRNATYPAFAVFDPKTKQWDVAGGAEVNIMSQNLFYYHHSTLWRGELFTSDGNQIKKYDFKTRQWQVLEISDGNNYELFTVNEHLYAANKSSVFEIVNDGKATRLMASSRRQPPVSALDTQDLGTPVLFEGPGHSLRLATQNKIFTWVNNDWREDADAPHSGRPPAILTNGLLFVSGGSYSEPARISRLTTESNAMETCLAQIIRSANVVSSSRPGTTTSHVPQSTWEMPTKFFVPRMPAIASHQSDLYLLMDHSESQDIINEQQHLIVGRKVVAKGGYHAELLCFSPNARLPQKLFLKFDDPNGCPPAGGSPGWMLATDDYLIFGLERSPLGFAPVPTETKESYKTGIWLLAASQLQQAIAAQK